MKFWQVDSFTHKPFSGNPAAIIVLEDAVPESLMQNIAMEMNLSETAFLLIESNSMRIRWFSPLSEVNICGHATLAAAHVLWSEQLALKDEVVFESKSGPLGVKRDGETYIMSFPSQPLHVVEWYQERLSGILGSEPLFVGSNGEDCVAIVRDEKVLRGLAPDFEGISSLSERGLVVSSRSDGSDYDYVYRAFFPKLGILEDPVTGSVQTSLAPYWSAHLARAHLRSYQASRRGGVMGVEVTYDRVLISGQCVTVATGNLSVS